MFYVKKSYRNKKYSAEFKIKAVTNYLTGKEIQREICKKYGVLGHSTLQDWILWYNVHKKLRSEVLQKLKPREEKQHRRNDQK